MSSKKPSFYFVTVPSLDTKQKQPKTNNNNNKRQKLTATDGIPVIDLISDESDTETQNDEPIGFEEVYVPCNSNFDEKFLPESIAATSQESVSYNAAPSAKDSSKYTSESENKTRQKSKRNAASRKSPTTSYRHVNVNGFQDDVTDVCQKVQTKNKRKDYNEILEPSIDIYSDNNNSFGTNNYDEFCYVKEVQIVNEPKKKGRPKKRYTQ